MASFNFIVLINRLAILLNCQDHQQCLAQIVLHLLIGVMSADCSPQCKHASPRPTALPPPPAPLPPSIFQVYSFNSTTGDLVGVDGTTTIADSISQIKWCPDCKHLVAAGLLALYVYDFYQNYSPALVLSTSADYNGTSYYSVNVCDNCEYIAAGGNNSSGFGEVDIYKFESQPTPSLMFVISTTIPSAAANSNVFSVAWCQGCDNLAIAGNSFDESGFETDVVQLYHFDSSTGSLTLIPTPTISFTPYSIDWCGVCCNYLAVGGNLSGRALLLTG